MKRQMSFGNEFVNYNDLECRRNLTASTPTCMTPKTPKTKQTTPRSKQTTTRTSTPNEKEKVSSKIAFKKSRNNKNNEILTSVVAAGLSRAQDGAVMGSQPQKQEKSYESVHSQSSEEDMSDTEHGEVEAMVQVAELAEHDPPKQDRPTKPQGPPVGMVHTWPAKS